MSLQTPTTIRTGPRKLIPAPRMSCSRRMPHSIFWRAFEDGEVKVIGDEPGNTDYDPDRSEEAHTARRRLVAAEVSSRDTSLKRPTIVSLVVKPIGARETDRRQRSDAARLHARRYARRDRDLQEAVYGCMCRCAPRASET